MAGLLKTAFTLEPTGRFSSNSATPTEPSSFSTNAALSFASLFEGEGVGEALCVCEGVADADGFADSVTLALGDGLADSEMLAVGDGVGFAVGVAEAEGVGLADGKGAKVGDFDGSGFLVKIGDGEGLAVTFGLDFGAGDFFTGFGVGLAEVAPKARHCARAVNPAVIKEIALLLE